MKLLTVTVPCYNSQEYMEACLESLLKGGERMEIIIIDDGSKDRTGAIADRYAEQYPSIVRVIHQENGGHGEGINQGLLHATGKYFKVVDSDDTLSDDLVSFLDTLESCDVDLFVTNYYYVHSDGKGDRAITYSLPLPQNREFTWAETKPFLIHELLTIHSCTFRTEAMRKWNCRLPKHVFYEDNLMVCQTLPYVEKLYYMNVDLYRYWIGRPDQSVQKNVMMKRYTHQLLVAERCFASVRLDDTTDKRLKKYLKHELFMMFGIGILYTRIQKNREADANLDKMWENCARHDKKWADHFRYRTPLALICLPGHIGWWLSQVTYWFAYHVVRFT